MIPMDEAYRAKLEEATKDIITRLKELGSSDLVGNVLINVCGSFVNACGDQTEAATNEFLRNVEAAITYHRSKGKVQ